MKRQGLSILESSEVQNQKLQHQKVNNDSEKNLESQPTKFIRIL